MDLGNQFFSKTGAISVLFSFQIQQLTVNYVYPPISSVTLKISLKVKYTALINKNVLFKYSLFIHYQRKYSSFIQQCQVSTFLKLKKW